MLTVRTTTLESFHTCPLKFMEVEEDWSNDDTLLRMFLGDIGHLAHQDPEYGLHISEYYFEELLPKIKGNKDNILHDKFTDILGLIAEFVEEMKNYKLIFEMRLATIVEEVFVTGTLDCLTKKEDGYHIYDFKIAAGSSYYSDIENRLQPMLYSYLVMKTFGVEEVNFTYLVYEKRTKPILNKINKVYKLDEIEDKIKEIVNEYKMAQEIRLYKPRKNIFCRGCPLYKNNKCPLYKVDDYNLNS